MLSRQLEQRQLARCRQLIGRGREDGRRPGRPGTRAGPGRQRRRAERSGWSGRREHYGPDEAAIAQLRALLSHAGSVGDLLSVQNQINDEEASLESMQAQQRALSHETTYATVSLTLLGPKAKPLVHRPKAPRALAGGFGAGWRALRVTVSWTLAFLGAIAPFAAIAAIAGYVIYRGRRRLIRRRPTAQSASGQS